MYCWARLFSNWNIFVLSIFTHLQLSLNLNRSASYYDCVVIVLSDYNHHNPNWLEIMYVPSPFVFFSLSEFTPGQRLYTGKRSLSRNSLDFQEKVLFEKIFSRIFSVCGRIIMMGYWMINQFYKQALLC